MPVLLKHFKIYDYSDGIAMQPMQKYHCSWCRKAFHELLFPEDIEMRVTLPEFTNPFVYTELSLWKVLNDA